MSDSERMISRLMPPAGAEGSGPGGQAFDTRTRGLDFLIEIPGSDGQTLLRMFERNGRLAVECDESRLEEGAVRFVHEMMRWSGLVGIRWKSEAIKAAGG